MTSLLIERPSREEKKERNKSTLASLSFSLVLKTHTTQPPFASLLGFSFLHSSNPNSTTWGNPLFFSFHYFHFQFICFTIYAFSCKPHVFVCFCCWSYVVVNHVYVCLCCGFVCVCLFMLILCWICGSCYWGVGCSWSIFKFTYVFVYVYIYVFVYVCSCKWLL